MWAASVKGGESDFFLSAEPEGCLCIFLEGEIIFYDRFVLGRGRCSGALAGVLH